MINPDHPRLSICRQCELVSISRASFYRQLAGETPEALAEAIYACEYERPVAALAAMLADGALQMAAHPAG